VKISQKILLGFLLVCVFVSLSGVPTSLYYVKIINAVLDVKDRDLKALDLLHEMERLMLEMDASLSRKTNLPKDQLLKHLQEYEKHWSILRSELPEFLPNDQITTQQLLEIDENKNDWFDGIEKFLRSGSKDYDRLPNIDDLQEIYNRCLSLQDDRLSRDYDTSVHAVEQTGELEWALRLIAILVGLITCIVVIRSVKQPLQRLMKATQEISEGRFEKVPALSGDELGQLTKSFNAMSQSLHERTMALEEQRRLAIQASELKTEFLANTSHELRTPLNTIIGYSQLILEGLARNREEELKYLSTIQQSSKQLLALINDVLDIARIEAGQMVLDLQPVSVQQVFEYVEEHMRLPAQKKGLDLNVSVEKGVDCARAHAGRLNQVLLNLMGNSIKFTSAGSVNLSAKLVSNGKLVCFMVRDTGIGIPPEKQHRLFQKFVQADGSMTRSYGGTGLGLALSKTLLELMEGSIELFSEGEGKGVTITFYLQAVQNKK
jgi:signal transduction histidine kinase